MLRVGLTGGLASGKSTVAGILRSLGAAVFDADGIVRALYTGGGEGAGAARELFGREVLDESGRVDRARIAAVVFTDPEKRHALEARIHPLVRSAIAERFEEARRSGAPVAVAEASQILEAGSEAAYDRLLVVVAPDAERLRRWEAKGGDVEDARRRMGAQLDPAESARRATDVIVNDGSVEDLAAKVESLYRKWMAVEGT